MMYRYFLTLLAVIAISSCGKKSDSDGSYGNYYVSAKAIIDITNNGWGYAEPRLKNKIGYDYLKSPENLGSLIKAEVHLPAIDDSNRVVKGEVLLNIAPDNRIFHASFDSEPVSKSEAYAMLLNYNNKSLQILTGITYSTGGYIQNGGGGNTTVADVLSKVTNNQEADQLSVTYHSAQGRYTAVVFSKNNGRYTFSFRGNQ